MSKQKLKNFFKKIGPGIITGAADDDPSGIATYSQTGAQFGYGLLWTTVFVLPFMSAVQESCARIGAVTGQGIAAVIRKHYGKKTVFAVVLLLLIANTINIGADIGAMAAAAQLLVPVPFVALAIFFAVLILIIEVFTSYRIYRRILKWFVIALLAYPLTVFLVHQPWLELLRATFIPNFQLDFAFFFLITGILGTTISPYMFFWEASEEVEDEKMSHVKKIGHRPVISTGFLRRIRWDNFAGMVFSQITTWCIIVVAATVLHSSGVTNIGTAADAAKALEPLVQTFPNAGFLAKLIFSVGIIGLGLLGIPVLAGSAAYATAEAMNWNNGLSLKFKKAHGFYGVIIISMLVGLLINFIGIDPIKALIFTAVINGVIAVPLIYFIAKIARNKNIMGDKRSGWFSNILVWGTFLIMLASALAMFYTLWN